MIPGLQRGHTWTAFNNHTGTLMAQNGRKQPLGICPRQRELIRMANPRRLDLNQNLPGTWAVKINFHDFKRLSGGDGHCGSGAH